MTRGALLTRWILANGVGMALGFLAFVNIVFFVAFGLQFELYWTEPQDDLENAEELLRRALVLGCRWPARSSRRSNAGSCSGSRVCPWGRSSSCWLTP